MINKIIFKDYEAFAVLIAFFCVKRLHYEIVLFCKQIVLNAKKYE